VPRFMPWRVGQLVTVYLTYVQPLMERLSVAMGHGCGRSEYLWADANGPWDTTKLTKVMKQRSGEVLGAALGTMDYRHAAVGMGRRFVGAEFARGYQAENEEVDEPEVESDDPLEISAGRGSAIGVNRYAVPSDIVKHLSEKNIQMFRPLSESWHRFSGLESRKASAGEEVRPPAKRSRTSMSDLMMPAPDNSVRSSPPRASAAKMSTSSDCSITSVRSIPAGALAPATPRTPRTTAPACLDDPGMIMVVIPYRRLMDDTVRKARALRIDCVEWTYGVEDPATIVFISADRLSRSFFDYVGRMRSKGLLRKTYIDECHLAVMAHSWRPKVAKLSELRGIGVPLVMLTATAPLHMESDLESTMSSTVSTSWIRVSTARRTTKYTVNNSIANGRLMEEAIRRCKNLTAQLKRRERMVAYCRSKADCEKLAGELDCGFLLRGQSEQPGGSGEMAHGGGHDRGDDGAGDRGQLPRRDARGARRLTVRADRLFARVRPGRSRWGAGRLARTSRARVGGEERCNPQAEAHDLESRRACDGRVREDESLPEARSGKVFRPCRARRLRGRRDGEMRPLLQRRDRPTAQREPHGS
jgi:hypothetical protein